MGSMSGAVFIGEFHPNDAELIPSHVIQILEGNSLALIVTPLFGGPHQRWLMVDPSRALDTLMAAAALALPGSQSHPLATRADVDASQLSDADIAALRDTFVAARPGVFAALGRGCIISTNELVDLNDNDIIILQPVYQRTYSHWSDEHVIFDTRIDQQ